MCLLALPMVLLYELGILLVKGGTTAKARAGVAG
jgi:Sec-independent protein secretion pathway component TatC